MSDPEEIIGDKIRKIELRPDRLFVIGDIHGSLSELEVLLKFLTGDQQLSQQDQVIFIGDYIDRGPDSRQVVDRLLQLKQQFPATAFLRGNHEDMLLSYLGMDGDGADFYLQNGGKETFKSYGTNGEAPLTQILANIPPEHIEFYKNLEYGLQLGEFIFVHAGIDPGKTLELQSKKDVLWIRHAFTQSDHDLQKIVVFGHTPFEEIFFDLPYKLGIDTGLVYGNKLTCLELVHGMVYQVEARDTTVQVAMLPRNAEDNQAKE